MTVIYCFPASATTETLRNLPSWKVLISWAGKMLPVYQASGVTPELFTCRPANRRIKTVAMGNWLSGPAPAKREAMLLSSQAAAAYAGPLFHDSFCKGNSYGYGLCGAPGFLPPAGAKSAWTLRREKRAYLPHMEKSSSHLRYSAADAPPRRREDNCAQQPGCAR